MWEFEKQKNWHGVTLKKKKEIKLDNVSGQFFGLFSDVSCLLSLQIEDSTNNSVQGTNAPPISATTDFSPFELEDEVLIEPKSAEFPESGRNSRRNEFNSAQEVTSENLWERTEVLAGKERFRIGFKKLV